MPPSDDLTYVAAGVDIIASLMCVFAMQVITVRNGFFHSQRLALGVMGCFLLWNGISNPSIHWFGEHHLPGFLIDCSLLAFLTIFCLRGMRARRVDPSFRVENRKQLGEYVKDFLTNDEPRNGHKT